MKKIFWSFMTILWVSIGAGLIFVTLYNRYTENPAIVWLLYAATNLFWFFLAFWILFLKQSNGKSWEALLFYGFGFFIFVGLPSMASYTAW